MLPGTITMHEFRTFLAGCLCTAILTGALLGGCVWFVHAWYGPQATALLVSSTTSSAAAGQAGTEASQFAYALHLTDYCASLVTYADTVASERAGGVARAKALHHIADTTFAYKNGQSPRALDAARAIIDAVYDAPAGEVRARLAPLWKNCHATALVP